MTPEQETQVLEMLAAFQNGKRLVDLPSADGTNPFDMLVEVLQGGESNKAALIGRQGEKGVYGSENLILYMIDVHNRGLDELEYGHKALDEFELENLPEFKEMIQERNKVTGISGLFQKGGYYGRLAGLL